MYLKKAHNRATGKTYLSIAEGYWDPERGHTRTRVVRKLGFLEELRREHDDPVAHFEGVVREMNREKELDAAEYTVSARKNQQLEKNTSGRRNYGHVIILRLLHELGLDRFLINRRQRDTRIECDTNAVMKLLVISRILSPGSKKKAFEEKDRYFDFERRDAFGLADVYRSLSHFAGMERDIQRLVHDRVAKTQGRDTSVVYYDVTNYYFETEQEDALRKKGVSKEHRTDPIVQLGLAMDADGVPISYELFPGSESEKLHLRPMISRLYREYGARKLIAVADPAQNTGNNIYYLDRAGMKYVFSQSIRGGSREFRDYVTDETGYEWSGDEYKRKSDRVRREIYVDFDRTDGTTRKQPVMADQRRIVFYSKKYAERARAKREAALLKARKIVMSPSAYTRATSYGALRYVMNVEEDKKTGELRPAKAGKPCLNLDAIRQEEKYDGYYAIVTNLFDGKGEKEPYTDGQVIDMYRGLWRIEDSFRVTKSELESRPVYLSREDRIRAHFLICYVALVILRLIQKRTGHKHSPASLIEAMNRISCSHEGGNLFLFDYRSDVSDALGDAFGIDFSMQRLTRAEIKKNIGSVKKG